VLKRIAVTTALTAALALPVQAGAQSQDLRNPDRRAPVASQTQDLRNPDRRAPETVHSSPAPSVTAIEAPSNGFDWGDAGIGAAGGAAILSLLAALTMAAAHHRRTPRVTA
jgi:hypothetical protein